jgi:hypothetical protein
MTADARIWLRAFTSGDTWFLGKFQKLSGSAVLCGER